MSDDMGLNRRGFLKSFGAAGILIPVAPAICRAEWLMPVSSVVSDSFVEDELYYKVVRRREIMVSSSSAHKLTTVTPRQFEVMRLKYYLARRV